MFCCAALTSALFEITLVPEPPVLTCGVLLFLALLLPALLFLK